MSSVSYVLGPEAFAYESPVKKAVQGLINVSSFTRWATPVSHKYGNRCAHNVGAPNLKTNLKVSRKMHSVVVQLMGRIDAYMDDAHVLDFVELARSSSRQTRSERREGIVVTLKTILHFLDLPSMKIARFVRATGELKPITIKDLHVYSGLSFSRFKRAWLDLVHSGLFGSVPQYEKETSVVAGNTKFKGLPSIKFMRKSLFTMFGLDKALESVQQKKRQQKFKAAKRMTRAQKKVAEMQDAALAAKAKRSVAQSVSDSLGGLETIKAIRQMIGSKSVGGCGAPGGGVDDDDDDDLMF